MPQPSPVHESTAPRCSSFRWKDWNGYAAVCSYQPQHDAEYFALRHTAGLIDVTPLVKYDICGPEAAAMLNRLLARPASDLAVNQVRYVCWCDENGHVLDDGTITRLTDRHFRLTANQHGLHWLDLSARGLNCTIRDVTASLAVLAVQGPNSRDLLATAADEDLSNLRYFRGRPLRLFDTDLYVTRTGYTGDLGFELWIPAERASAVYERLLTAGAAFGLVPVGLDAMDVTRIEAGFVLNGVDYFSANRCLIEARKSTPYDLGFDWMVRLHRPPFNGQVALRAAARHGPAWKLVGLQYDWDEYEALFARHGLPPDVCTQAWRSAVPVYSYRQRQIGQATSGAWSPLLKQNLALATVRSEFAVPGTPVRVEVTAEYQRETVKAFVTNTPFFDPPRKKS